MTKTLCKRVGNPATQKLTVSEVKRIAMNYYNRGGDMIIECWDDKDIRKWIQTSGGTMEALMRELRLADMVRRDIESTIW